MPVQVKYTMLLTLVSGSITLVMIFIMAWFIQRNYNLFMGDELGISAQVIEIVRHEQKMLELSLFTLFLVSITVMFGTAYYVTARLVGPMVAIRRHLFLYSRGDWTHDFRLRKNDEFREIEPLVNSLRTALLNTAAARSEIQKSAT